jgi:hypothetical protein
LNQGPQTVNVTVPYAGQGFWKASPLNDGSIIFGSGAYPSTWKFDCATGLWTRRNTNTTEWYIAGIDQTENYAMRLDTDRNRVCMGVGGPYAWRMAGQPDISSPFNGDVEYDPVLDQWFVPYPNRGTTYVPATPGDTAHWDASGIGKIVSYFDGASGYWNQKLFGFGCYSVGVGALRYRDMTTGNITVLTNDVPLRDGPRAYTQGSVDPNGQAWCFGNNFDYCTWDFGAPINSPWVHHVITNPPVIPPLATTTSRAYHKRQLDLHALRNVLEINVADKLYDESPRAATVYTDSGAIAELNPNTNQILIWCGLNAPSGGWPGTVPVQKTWLLDRATLVCTEVTPAGANPPAVTAVAYSLFYNPARKTMQMVVQGAGNAAEVWEFTQNGGGNTGATGGETGTTGATGETGATGSPTGSPGNIAPPGSIAQTALPASSGSVYGVNYYGFPFTSNGGSKQSDIFTNGQRIYAQGGDTIHSATDGTWSCDMNGGDWQLEVGQPAYPSLPAPHALQDDFGRAWVASKNKFLLWPGGFFAYDPPGTPILNYTGGCWWFDPATRTYEQDTTLFPNQPYNGVSPGITAPSCGCPYGGFYDPATEQFGILADSQGAFGCQMWDSKTMTKLPFIPFTLTTRVGTRMLENIPQERARELLRTRAGTVAYYTRTQYAVLDGYVYVMGQTTTDGSTFAPGFWRYNIATHQMQTLAAANDAQGNPVKLVKDLSTQINPSNGKVVWLKVDGPDGIVRMVLVYTPSTNSWAQDVQTFPASWIGSVSCPLPDGRIAFCGAQSGQKQFNFYRAA